MKDHLKHLLDPGDDGRAFTEAVLLRAAGALYRRRQPAADAPVWGWLERWARPWMVAVLAALAVASAVPALTAPSAGLGPDPVAEATILSVPQPDVMLAVMMGN